MSVISINTSEIHWPSVEGLGAFFKKMQSGTASYLQGRRVYRQTIRELSLCSDRDLRDIGIARCDIRRLAHEAAAMTSAQTV